MSAVLDNITGGGLLPHVYCQNIILDDDTVTLNMYLLQEQRILNDSSWLNSLNAQGQNFLDSIFIQVLPFRKTANVARLEPDYNPTDNPGNIYTAKYHLGDNYLPRGALVEYGAAIQTAEGDILGYVVEPSETFKGEIPGKLFDEESLNFPSPIQVSNSSLLGNIAGADAMPNYVDHGDIQLVNIDKKTYYKIPFQHVESLEEGVQNLGFAFYAFLNVPYWLENLDIGVDISSNSSFFEEFIIEGPPNAEIVFKNGKLDAYREAFFLPDGASWEGAVHLHTEENPAPDGYYGDGSGNSIDFTGWMVGESHNPKEIQEKLYLKRPPNNKIIDQRSDSIFMGAGLVEDSQQDYTESSMVAGDTALTEDDASTSNESTLTLAGLDQPPGDFLI